MGQREIIDYLERRPEMLGVARTYDAAVTYLLGLDMASHGGFLCGFQELVELKAGRTSSLGWPVLLLHLEPGLGADSPEVDRLERLFAVLKEYVNVDCGGSLDRRRIYHEWTLMAQAKSGYNPDLIRHRQSPAPDTVTLAEAANLLGVSLDGALDLIHDGVLSASRIGGVVHISRTSIPATEDGH